MKKEEALEKRYDDYSSYSVRYKSLTVEGYKCFKEKQTIDFLDANGKPAKWTVILGENGTGKTSILQLLDTLRQHKIRKIEKEVYFVSKQIGYNDGVNFGFDDSLFVESSLFTSNDLTGELYEYSYTQYSSVGTIPSSELVRSLPCFFAYGATRRIGGAALSDREKNDDTTSTLYDPSVELINAEEWFLQAFFAEKNAKGDVKTFYKNRRSKVEETLIALLPDVDKIRVKEITKEQDRAAIEVHMPYGWVEMHEMSHGYKTLIAWTVDLAAGMHDRYPDSANPLAESAIVLVDEIDLHLHPKWQRTLMHDLSLHFPNVQFIVTAHSPLIVQAADENTNVVLLKRVGDHVVIENDIDVIKGWRVDQILASDLYDNISTRPPEYDDLLEERDKLLNKKTLTKKDKIRLEEISAEIQSWPNTYEMDEATKSLLEETKELLKQHGQNK